ELEAEAPAPLPAPLVLLGLWALLASVQGSQGRPSWRYVSSEVVIPRKETHRGKGFQVPGWLTYSLRFGGQRHVIHLRPKKLMPRHLLVTTQDDQGALQMDYPYIPADCHYLGYLEEIPLSMVAVDKCYGGLDGVMKLDDLAYEIKPLRDSRSFEHVVSQIVAETNTTRPRQRPKHEEEVDSLLSKANLIAAPRVSSKLFAMHGGVVKGVFMATNELYRSQGNMSACTVYLVRLCGITNAILQTIDMSVYVSALLVFDQRDPTPVNDYRVPGSPFYRFYSRVLFAAFRPSMGYLVFAQGPYELDVSPSPYAICRGIGIIMLGVRSRHYVLVSVIAAQQLGRSMGFYYDAPQCRCQRRTTCVMFYHPEITDTFSNCSIVNLLNVRNGKAGECLFEDLVYYNQSLTNIRCGNYIVEEQEQCDCGSFQQCYNNKCCESDCQYSSESICDRGLCCTNCTYSPAGTLCRPIRGICDLPEYCVGQSQRCPANTYLQDGTPCTEEGYCFSGNCTDRNFHCKELFGANAFDGFPACYSINQRGNRFGHCYKQGTSRYFVRCSRRDIMCGRLQCMNVSSIPQLQEHASFHQTFLNGAWCYGEDTHRGTGVRDLGQVRNGAPCAHRMVCNNTFCNGTLEEINYDCAPDKCSHRGVCNNKRNCHCHRGWDPPLCLAPGAGGSVDSGPPPKRRRKITQNQQSVLYLRLVFARIYALIVALLFGVVTNVRTINTTKAEEKTYPGPTGQ
uniref:Disintegrin and metalloproteinase domain-containing protein 21 n=1 Tax=Prolemur simus TaxID=1328070 RepID=A0A8C9DS17_PROSS